MDPDASTPSKSGALPAPMGSSDFEAIDPAHLNELLPSYAFLSLLGMGGMGMVYLAEQRALGRRVAIKVLPPVLMKDENSAARFDREARAMAHLNHPNIVSVIDYGKTSEGHLYIVMEFVEGGNLEQRLKSGNLTVEHLYKWIPQVCDALDYAHAKGIVHRDIKPANIMIAPDVGVKIADFGIARLCGDQHQNLAVLTRSDTAVGTLHYLAPEAMEQGREIDHRIDVYAVGVMLYQMLTGKLPYGSWEPPSERTPGLDPRLDEVVVHAVDPNPDTRTHRAGEIGTALREIAHAPRTLAAGLEVGPEAAREGRPAPSPPPESQAAPSARHASERRDLRGASPPDRTSTKKLVQVAIAATIAVSALVITLLLLSNRGKETAEDFAESPSPADESNPSTTAAASRSESRSGTPEGLPVDAPAASPVRIIVVAGQTNVGGVVPLNRLAEAISVNPDAPAFDGLRGGGEWIERSDAWLSRWDIQQPEGFHSPLSASSGGFARAPKGAGICLGIGMTVAEAIEEDLVLVQVAAGPCSLGIHFRPSQAGEADYRNLIKEVPPEHWGQGYQFMLRSLASTLDALPALTGSPSERGYELSALVWFQGWNDSVQKGLAERYGDNLATLVGQFRIDTASPVLAIVVPEFTPRGAIDVSGQPDFPGRANELLIRSGQRDFVARPAFDGYARLVPTLAFVNEDAEGPPFLYRQDPYFFLPVGRAIGRTVLEMMEQPARDRSAAIRSALDEALAANRDSPRSQ